VDNKYVQWLKNFKYLGCEICYENEKDIQQKVAKFAQIVGIPNNTFKQSLVQKSSRVKVYNALALPILLYGSEIWTLRQKDKRWLISTEMKFIRTAGYRLFWPQKEWRHFGRVESSMSWCETKKIQIQLATTHNKSEKQQDVKNNVELWTKWAKTTWKMFEDAIRRGWNRSVRSNLWQLTMITSTSLYNP
jgi:hypothetical protein